jgi:hypothetical protein
MWANRQVKVVFHYNNVKVMWSMLMKSWAILGSNEHIIWFKHNIGGEGCNYKFNNFLINVWCVTKFRHLLMHLHFTYNSYQLWGLGIGGVWILLAHWIWHLAITNMFYLWLSISKWLELVLLSNCSNEGVANAFLDKALNRFGAPTGVFIDQGTKFCGELY